jgi:hypothetical protein
MDDPKAIKRLGAEKFGRLLKYACSNGHITEAIRDAYIFRLNAKTLGILEFYTLFFDVVAGGEEYVEHDDRWIDLVGWTLAHMVQQPRYAVGVLIQCEEIRNYSRLTFKEMEIGVNKHLHFATAISFSTEPKKKYFGKGAIAPSKQLARKRAAVNLLAGMMELDAPFTMAEGLK